MEAHENCGSGQDVKAKENCERRKCERAESLEVDKMWKRRIIGS
jgi:hypothetical protein